MAAGGRRGAPAAGSLVTGAPAIGPELALRRVRARVEGTVQGVGFRPFAFRLARELGLAGHVRNDAHGVVLEAEGPRWAVDAFLVRLRTEAPPLARVRGVRSETLAPTGERGFAIRASVHAGTPHAAVTPDTATCADCVAELFDPADRRFRYPFVNCTNCGPRFTIVRGVPYDRPLTTMAAFEMCAACRREYDDPFDRRFHAQPNACPACGPTVRLIDREGGEVDAGTVLPLSLNDSQSTVLPPADALAAADPPAEADPADPVAAAAQALRRGAIVAVKGIGGYHLACRADDESAVATLRARKRREQRPFALMVGDVQAARRLVLLDEAHEQLLCAAERPIVLARSWAGARVAPSVAPGLRELGVMLPYSPLHLLLLGDAGVPLVLTSGNLSDEPIAYEDEDARERLAAVADLFLVHDRPIETRTDDSVARVVTLSGRARPLLLRRSRGLVPAALDLPVAAREPILGCGAQQKSTFCLAKGSTGWVGHHVGDLGNWVTERSLREGVAHFERLFAIAPRTIAHDLHPGYRATAYARERAGESGDAATAYAQERAASGAAERAADGADGGAADDPSLRLVGVQHHHAHLAACLAEHGLRGPAVGAIYDGTGYGADGTVWGGELLVGGLDGCERAAHLRCVRMPGGEQAIREPWRMACAWLAEAHGEDRGVPRTLTDRVDPQRWEAVAALARSGVASPLTSSMGRLFDAVAALCGLHAEVTYEGQAAVALEAAADPVASGSYPLPLRADGTLDGAETIRAVAGDLDQGAPVGAVAACFHAGVAAGTASACAMLAERHGLDVVVLSGGVFQNRLLLERTAAVLERDGLRVLVPELLPCNDGGIAYGQVAVAAALTG